MTTQKKNLTDYGNAMGFEVPAGATQKQAVEGELIPDHDETQEAEFTDIPEHSNDALPVHKRSLPKVLLAIMAVTVLFGLPAYLFLSAASGGGGATNVVKADGKDKNVSLKDPQADEINRLKTDLAVGKQLASATSTPSPSPSNSPTPEDKATTAKPSPSPTTTSAAPITSTPPVVAKASPPAAAPVAANPRPVAPSAAVPVAAKTIPLPVAPSVSTPLVAKTIPKPIVATNPLTTPVVTKASPKPVETVVAKAPPKPTETAPAPVAVKPEPKPVSPAAAPKAIAKPETLQVKPEPKPVTPPVIVATNPTPATTPISWEQASAAGVYGGDSIMPQAVGGLGVAPGAKSAGKDAKQQQRSSYEGAMSPTLLLAAGTNVKGHTLAPYSVGISKNQSDAVPLSIALDEPIELGKGYHLPVGTTVNFIASVRDNGSVVATSKNADIGGVEVQLPEGAISLASDNNGLLMTKEINTGEGDLARADVNSSIWGGIAGAGKTILQAGGQTTTNTGLLGTTTIQTNNSSPNITGGAVDGAFTPLANNSQKRAQQKAEQIQQRSKLNTIDVGTKVKLFVNAPIQVQIPVSGQQVVEQTVEDEELIPPPKLLTSNSTPAPTISEEVPPPSRTPVAPPPLVVKPETPVPSTPPTTPNTKSW